MHTLHSRMALGARRWPSPASKLLYLNEACLPGEQGAGKGALLELQIFKILLSTVTRIKPNFGAGAKEPKIHSDFPVLIFLGGRLLTWGHPGISKQWGSSIVLLRSLGAVIINPLSHPRFRRILSHSFPAKARKLDSGHTQHSICIKII